MNVQCELSELTMMRRDYQNRGRELLKECMKQYAEKYDSKTMHFDYEEEIVYGTASNKYGCDDCIVRSLTLTDNDSVLCEAEIENSGATVGDILTDHPVCIDVDLVDVCEVVCGRL